MHELVLLRHAEAEIDSPDGGDIGRALTERGRRAAHAAGQWLLGHGVQPVRVLCSPASRTRQTLEQIQAALGTAETLIAPEIYEATPGELLALLDNHLDAGTVLLVGHNPGLERLVALLLEGRSDEFRGMPTAGIAVLHLDQALEPASARLNAFWSP
ncbi:SixA phosphatase family protein [Frateuria aurantia]